MTKKEGRVTGKGINSFFVGAMWGEDILEELLSSELASYLVSINPKFP